jgi:hypothetical protein
MFVLWFGAHAGSKRDPNKRRQSACSIVAGRRPSTRHSQRIFDQKQISPPFAALHDAGNAVGNVVD